MSTGDETPELIEQLRGDLAELQQNRELTEAALGRIERMVFRDFTVPKDVMDVCVVLGSYAGGYRLKAALALGGTGGTRYVVTGGNPVATGETEAAYMRGLLVEAGVSAEWIHCDTAATSTIENLRHAAHLVEGLRIAGRDLKVAVVTAGFHLARTMSYAREAFAGMTGVVLYPSPAYGPNTRRDNWHLNKTGRAEIGYELEKLIRFGM